MDLRLLRISTSIISTSSLPDSILHWNLYSLRSINYLLFQLTNDTFDIWILFLSSCKEFDFWKQKSLEIDSILNLSADSNLGLNFTLQLFDKRQ